MIKKLGGGLYDAVGTEDYIIVGFKVGVAEGFSDIVSIGDDTLDAIKISILKGYFHYWQNNRILGEIKSRLNKDPDGHYHAAYKSVSNNHLRELGKIPKKFSAVYVPGNFLAAIFATEFAEFIFPHLDRLRSKKRGIARKLCDVLLEED